MNYKFLGDIIVVEHLGSNVVSNTLIIPEEHRKDLKPIEAKVLAIGKLVKPRKDYLKIRRKRGCDNKVFACDYLKEGDTVLVYEHLGTRGRVPFNDKAIIYDSEDVIALIESSNNNLVPSQA